MPAEMPPMGEADKKLITYALSAGGHITMPVSDMFRGGYFGTFTDKYGINRMLHFQNS
jgi:PhnB protein